MPAKAARFVPRLASAGISRHRPLAPPRPCHGPHRLRAASIGCSRVFASSEASRPGATRAPRRIGGGVFSEIGYGHFGEATLLDRTKRRGWLPIFHAAYAANGSGSQGVACVYPERGIEKERALLTETLSLRAGPSALSQPACRPQWLREPLGVRAQVEPFRRPTAIPLAPGRPARLGARMGFALEQNTLVKVLLASIDEEGPDRRSNTRLSRP